MADDLDVSAATWGTADLLLVSGDDIDGATGYGWGSQVAKNTGVLYYMPRQASWYRTNDGTTIQGIWLTAGTYSVYAVANFNAAGTDVMTGTLYWDGTVVLAGDSDDGATITGSKCGWVWPTTGWVAITTAIGPADGDGIANLSSAYRFGSWAP